MTSEAVVTTWRKVTSTVTNLLWCLHLLVVLRSLIFKPNFLPGKDYPARKSRIIYSEKNNGKYKKKINLHLVRDKSWSSHRQSVNISFQIRMRKIPYCAHTLARWKPVRLVRYNRGTDFVGTGVWAATTGVFDFFTFFSFQLSCIPDSSESSPQI